MTSHLPSKSSRALLGGFVVALLVALVAPAVAGAAIAEDAIPGLRNSVVKRVAATQRTTPYWTYTYYTKGASWATVGPQGWTAGFLPGELWTSYALTGDSWYRDSAASRQTPLSRPVAPASQIDIGFRYVYSYALGYRLTGNSSYRSAALAAAAAEAAHFDSKVGASYRSATSTSCEVIIDNLMNVQLLEWAADNGAGAAGTYRWMAHQHALTVAHDLVRPDGSTIHYATYDRATGSLLTTGTLQGYSADSMWARGQAWAIAGFTSAYQSSHDPMLLDTARRVADRFLAELPADKIPYWDFRDPEIPSPSVPRDTSAAAIAASGLLQLASVEPDPANRARYETAAGDIMSALSAPEYLSAGQLPSLLLHGTHNYPGTVDVGLAYGDYFYLDALLRTRALPTARPAIPVRKVWAKAGKPYRAIDNSFSSAWVSKGKASIDLDLRSRKSVSAVGVAVRYGDSRCAPLKVYVSNDRKHWKAVTAGVSSGLTNKREVYSFGAVRARFVRLTVNGTSRGSSNGITDIRVY